MSKKETFIKDEWYVVNERVLLKYDYIKGDKFWASKYIYIKERHLNDYSGHTSLSNSIIRKANHIDLVPMIYKYPEEFNYTNNMSNVLVSFNDKVNTLIQATNTLTNKINLIQE